MAEAMAEGMCAADQNSGHNILDDSGIGLDSPDHTYPEMNPPDASIHHQNVSSSRTAWNADKKVLIVDVEGFQLRKDFYVKELAFSNPATQEYWVGTFKPPYDRQALKKRYNMDIDWVTANLHGLRWEEGIYPYSVAFAMINFFGNSHQLYAKGRDKCIWIQQYTATPVLDLEQLGCPPARDLPFGSYCIFHNTLHKSCALDKAVRYCTYINGLFAMNSVLPSQLYDSREEGTSTNR